MHGSWIKYEELENYKPLFYFPVDDMNNLAETIIKAFISDKIVIPKEVMELIKSHGWNTTSSLMNEFFMSIV